MRPPICTSFFGTRQERILSHLRLKCSHANLDNIGMYTAINRLGFGDDTEVQHRLTLNIGPPARHAPDSARRFWVFKRRTPGVLLKLRQVEEAAVTNFSGVLRQYSL